MNPNTENKIEAAAPSGAFDSGTCSEIVFMTMIPAVAPPPPPSPPTITGATVQ